MHRGEQDRREILEATDRLHLQDHPEVRAAEFGEPVLQAGHVRSAAHERQADRVGVFDDERQMCQILLGERGQSQFGIRQVDALSRAEPRAARTGVDDAHP